MINWESSEEESRTIGLIIERASVIIENGQMPEYDRLYMSMDIFAAHLNGCPLDLDELLTSKEPDFMHDIYGIRRHISRKTGKILEYFVPRCAK